MKIEELKNKKVAVLGLGVEGMATAEYFLEHGIAFSVFDEKEKMVNNADLAPFDVIVRSPGVSLHKDYLQNLPSTTVITSQTKLFFDNCPAKIIGVTGTKGKGTTCSLIYEMLKKSGFDAYLGGNIGRPPVEFLDTLNAQSIVVLELSSFQLEDLQKSPNVSVMLMVTSDHLEPFGNRNFHKNLKEYVDAKRNILRFQTSDDMAVINTDYPATRESAEKTSAKIFWVSRYKPVGTGCFVRDNKVVLRTDGEETEVIDVAQILLPGAHNLENVCAAVMTSHHMGVAIADMAYVLKTFKGLEHRLELVRELDGVRYYDDSIATSPESALAGVQAFSQPKIVILGGITEGSDFIEFAKYVATDPSVKAIVGIGKEWPTIKKLLDEYKDHEIVYRENLTTMNTIVEACRELASTGDIVLLSPACKSYDMFESYKDRGEQFKKYVNLL